MYEACVVCKKKLDSEKKCLKCGVKREGDRSEMNFFFNMLVEEDDDVNIFFGFNSLIELEISTESVDKIEEDLVEHFEGKIIAVEYFKKEGRNKIIEFDFI